MNNPKPTHVILPDAFADQIGKPTMLLGLKVIRHSDIDPKFRDGLNSNEAIVFAMPASLAFPQSDGLTAGEQPYIERLEQAKAGDVRLEETEEGVHLKAAFYRSLCQRLERIEKLLGVRP